MEYPLISEYREAILSAEDNFNELSSLRPVLDNYGNPVMSSGNFAVVFKMKDENDGKLYAVKCFIKDQEGRDESYRKIADELETVSSTYILQLRYLENELFVDSAQCDREEFPVVVMEWVEGETLDGYLKRHLNDKYELEMLSYRFNRMAAWLLPQPFAHSDLKPDNILVRKDGSLVLVDYDGMFVPSMKGDKAREIGSPNYRHPLRSDIDFDEHIDDFSIAVIALSLKAIAINPEIKKNVTSSDVLLFGESDFRDVATSSLFKELLSMTKNSDLLTLFGLLMIALSKGRLDTLTFRMFSTEKPKRNSESYYINFIRSQFLRVQKKDRYSFFAIVNILTSSEKNVVGGGSVRRVWLSNQDRVLFMCDIITKIDGSITGKYSGDSGKSWRYYQIREERRDIDKMVQFAYEVFKYLNLLDIFMENGDKAIDYMNNIRALSS